MGWIYVLWFYGLGGGILFSLFDTMNDDDVQIAC
jgi:hypothetical protein